MPGQCRRGRFTKQVKKVLLLESITAGVIQLVNGDEADAELIYSEVFGRLEREEFRCWYALRYGGCRQRCGRLREALEHVVCADTDDLAGDLASIRCEVVRE